jgi:protein-S-isoprenylcysteine O-methyltransferase Ste14
MSYLIIAIALWGSVHSLTASHTFKDWLRRTIGDRFMRGYRLLYNLFSAVSLAPVLYLLLILPDRDLYRIPPPWSWLLLLGQGLSALLLVVALLQTDVLSFIGLRQLIERDRPGALVVSGMYRHMRHPLYTFGLGMLWLSPSVSVNSFVAYLAFMLYIFVGIYFEERKLLREFGEAYAAYKSVTPMLIPGLRFGGNK